jgi:hypothetical protein
MSKFNVNTNHPLIPNSQDYTYYKKYVSIYSTDRDVIKFPNSSEFEIELPQDYLNVLSITVQSPCFPRTLLFTNKNNNIKFSFKINEPYNPIINNLNDPLQLEIYNALFSNINNNFIISIEEGNYIPIQMATELTNKMNEVVSIFIKNYLTSINSIYLSSFTSYSEFIVAYNEVSNNLWFGNKSSNFIITNTNVSLYGSNIENTINQCNNAYLPIFSYWGLPAYLGFTRCDSIATTSPDGNLPRFYYGDFIVGNNGYWLQPNTLLPNSNVFFLKTPLNINLTPTTYYFMDIKEINCIDQISPYNISNYTLTTNSNNGRVNSAFCKLRAGTDEDILAQLYNENVPYKLFEPPAERIRRLHISIRNHNGQLIDFGNNYFSFMLQFTLYSSQISRKYNLYNPMINS